MCEMIKKKRKRRGVEPRGWIDIDQLNEFFSSFFWKFEFELVTFTPSSRIFRQQTIIILFISFLFFSCWLNSIWYSKGRKEEEEVGKKISISFVIRGNWISCRRKKNQRNKLSVFCQIIFLFFYIKFINPEIYFCFPYIHHIHIYVISPHTTMS